MDKKEKVTAYFAQEHPFAAGIAQLREIALSTEVEETYKWQFPTYTVSNKNVFALCKFKSHFGIWFFNGVYLSDPLGVLQNAQEGKTMAMRHWKFTELAQLNEKQVLQYMQEAIDNQKEGKVWTAPKKKPTQGPMPPLLQDALDKDSTLKVAFHALSPYKQKEYKEHIAEAKQEKTKLKRMATILPMIKSGKGLHDRYR